MQNDEPASDEGSDEGTVIERALAADADLGGEAPCHAHLLPQPLD